MSATIITIDYDTELKSLWLQNIKTSESEVICDENCWNWAQIEREQIRRALEQDRRSARINKVRKESGLLLQEVLA